MGKKLSLLWCKRAGETTHQDLAQLVALGADVVHEHLVGRELVLDGQGVVLPLLHLLQFDAVPQVSHHLHPEPGLGGKGHLFRLVCSNVGGTSFLFYHAIFSCIMKDTPLRAVVMCFAAFS